MTDIAKLGIKMTATDADKILTALDKTHRKPRRIVKYKDVARAAEKVAGERLAEIERLNRRIEGFKHNARIVIAGGFIMAAAAIAALITLYARTPR